MVCTSSVFGTPSGSFGPSRSVCASSMMPMPRSVPAMLKRPRSNSMSAAAASSTWAAICRPCSMQSALASTIAAPDAIMLFEPPVPPPAISWSLSPCSSRTGSNGTPSRSHSTCANGVAWPWP